MVFSLVRLLIIWILILFLAVIDRCMALDDGDGDVFPIHSDLHQLAVDWLPFHQTLLHSFSRDDGDSFMMLVVVSTTE